jgi:topoisomerase IA-like protein
MNRNDDIPADAVKDPSEWTTGGEPMTGAQESYVHTLARQAGEDVPDEMTKAEASEMIEELREKTGKAKAPRAKAAKPRATAKRKPKKA